MFKECGCKVKLSGVLQIGNKVSSKDTWASIIFATNLKERDNANLEKVIEVKIGVPNDH